MEIQMKPGYMDVVEANDEEINVNGKTKMAKGHGFDRNLASYMKYRGEVNSSAQAERLGRFYETQGYRNHGIHSENMEMGIIVILGRGYPYIYAL
ncbi:hypothetical protein Bca101_026435 [Brassica carinata]